MDNNTIPRGVVGVAWIDDVKELTVPEKMQLFAGYNNYYVKMGKLDSTHVLAYCCLNIFERDYCEKTCQKIEL